MTDSTDLLELMRRAKADLLSDDKPPTETLLHFMHPNEYEMEKRLGNVRDGTMHGPPILIIQPLGSPPMPVAEYEARKKG